MPSDIAEIKPSRTLGRIWVVGTCLLISTISYSSQFFIIVPTALYSEKQYVTWRSIFVFNSLVLLVFYSYFRVVSTDPGSVPSTYAPDLSQEPEAPIEVKKLTGRPRYCRTCSKYKPPRAHHCRQCKRCVLRMDHHCPWVNNCVGHNNYGDFIRFLFFVDLACSMHIYLISKCAFGEAFSQGPEPSTAFIVALVMNYSLCCPVLLTVGFFSLYHFYLLATNTTTIESSEKDKAATMRRRGRLKEVRYPYNIGYLANIKSVLGENPLLWCLPASGKGDGLWYETSSSVDPTEQYDWPPVDHFEDDESVRRPLNAASAFTYGRERLNPALYQRTASLKAEEDDSEDEIPLGHLHHRRIRRGSEGYEIRPVGQWHRELQVEYGEEQAALMDGSDEELELTSDEEQAHV